MDEVRIKIIRQALIPIAEATSVGRLCNMSAWALLLWDWLTSINHEIEYFWKGPRSLPTALYFLNRYFSLIALTVVSFQYISTNVNQALCDFWYRFEASSAVITIFFAQCILSIRVYALWGSTKTVRYIILAVLIAGNITTCVMVAVQFRNPIIISRLFPTVDYNVCLGLRIEPFFQALWWAPLSVEIILFIMAAAKGMTTIKLHLSGNLRMQLLDVVLRDSLIYFIFVVVIELIAAVLWMKGNTTSFQAIVGYAYAIPSVLCSHLLINLREAYRSQQTKPVAFNNNNQTLELPTWSNGSTSSDGRKPPAIHYSSSWTGGTINIDEVLSIDMAHNDDTLWSPEKSYAPKSPLSTVHP